MNIAIYKYNNQLEIRASNIKIINMIESYFAIHVEGYQWMTAVKERRWDGKIKFYSHNIMKIGLLHELLTFCKLRGISYFIKFKATNNIPKEKLTKWIDTLKLPFKVRDYQFNILYDVLKYGGVTAQSETGSGKSWIIYALFRFMLKQNLKCLLIVPNIDLLYQMKKDFIEYGWTDVDNHLQIIGDKYNLKEFVKPMIISTWQSLYSKRSKLYNHLFRKEIKYIQENIIYNDIDKLNAISRITMIKKQIMNALKKYNIDRVKSIFKKYKKDFKITTDINEQIDNFEFKVKTEFNKIDCVIGDECDSTKADSLNHLLEKCTNTKFRLGLTGSMMNKEYASWYTVVSNFGRYKEYNDYAMLRDRKDLSDVTIRLTFFNYSDILKEKYHIEVPNKSDYRNAVYYTSTINERNFKLTKLINSKPNENWLLLFQFKDGEGHNYYESFKDTINNKLLYIDGDIKDRKSHISYMKSTKDNYVCLGSMNTMSRGINIPNLQNIILLSTFKNREKLIQAIGRLTRKHGNDKASVWDIIDNFVLDDEGNLKVNISITHYYERKKVYKEKKYKIKESKHEIK